MKKRKVPKFSLHTIVTTRKRKQQEAKKNKHISRILRITMKRFKLKETLSEEAHNYLESRHKLSFRSKVPQGA